VLLEITAYAADKAAAKNDVLMQPFPAQIDKAVRQAKLLGRLYLVGDRKRQRGGIALHLHVVEHDLYLTGRKTRVDGLDRASDDRALDGDHGFSMQPLDFPEKLLFFGLDDQLADPAVIAKVDEDQAPVIPLSVNPAGHPDLPVFVSRIEKSAKMRTESVL